MSSIHLYAEPVPDEYAEWAEPTETIWDVENWELVEGGYLMIWAGNEVHIFNMANYASVRIDNTEDETEDD